MTADFTIEQVGGAGAAAENASLLDCRAGVAITFTATTLVGPWSWSCPKRPSGAMVVLGNPTSRVMTITPPAVRGRYQVQLTESGGSRIIIFEVARDAAGALLDYGLSAVPSQGERPSFSSGGRGAQGDFERLIARLIIIIDEIYDAIDAGGGGSGDSITDGVGILSVGSGGQLLSTDLTAANVSVTGAALFEGGTSAIVYSAAAASLLGDSNSKEVTCNTSGVVIASDTDVTATAGAKLQADGVAEVEVNTALLDLNATTWTADGTTATWVYPTTTLTANTKLTLASTTEVEVNTGVLDLNATTLTLDTSGACAFVHGGNTSVDVTGSYVVAATGTTSITAAAGALTINAAGSVLTLLAAAVAILRSGDYIALQAPTKTSFGSTAADRAFLTWNADVAAAANTTVTVRAFTAVARPSVCGGGEAYVFVERASPTAATTAIWKVRLAHRLEGGVATPIGPDVVELVSGSDDGCSLIWDQSGATSRLRLTTPNDGVTRTSRHTGWEMT